MKDNMLLMNSHPEFQGNNGAAWRVWTALQAQLKVAEQREFISKFIFTTKNCLVFTLHEEVSDPVILQQLVSTYHNLLAELHLDKLPGDNPNIQMLF